MLSYSSMYSRRDSINCDLLSLPFAFVFVRETTLFLFDRGMMYSIALESFEKTTNAKRLLFLQ
jgi:hypothetical protein